MTDEHVVLHSDSVRPGNGLHPQRNRPGGSRATFLGRNQSVAAGDGRAVERCNRRDRGPPNGSEVHPQDASTRERTGGAPLAAMHKQLTLSVCKRRDAVRLALHEPARPAGAAFGVLSGATLSWAAPRQTIPNYAMNMRCPLPTGARAISRFHACGRTSEPKPLHVSSAFGQHAFSQNTALGHHTRADHGPKPVYAASCQARKNRAMGETPT